MTSPDLSIVFPAYNEEQRLHAALVSACEYLDGSRLTGEVVVADDGSTDGTAAVAEAYSRSDSRVRLVRQASNRGKGGAVRLGMLSARGRTRVFLDVDLATPVPMIDQLLPHLDRGAELVIGTRHAPDSVIEVEQKWLRRFMGGTFRRIAGALLPLGVTDITCGFKGMRGEVAQRLFPVLRETGWAFDAELLFVARKWGIEIAEVPVRWRDSGDTRVRPFANAWQSLQELVRIRRYDRRGAYDPALPGAAA